MLQVTDDTKQCQDCSRGGVIESCVLHTDHDIVSDCSAVLPLQDFGPEAVVCKAFGRVDEDIATELEMYVECLCPWAGLSR